MKEKEVKYLKIYSAFNVALTGFVSPKNTEAGEAEFSEYSGTLCVVFSWPVASD